MGIIYTMFSMCILFAMAVGQQESFNTTPTSVLSVFSCLGRQMGYYADLNTNCRAYHTCDDHGNHFIYYCPEDTAFRQDAMICDHAYRVDCRTNIHNVSKYNDIWQNSNKSSLPLFFDEPQNMNNNMKKHSRYVSINSIDKNFTSYNRKINSNMILVHKQVDERQIRPLFRVQEFNSNSRGIKVISKNHTDDYPFTIESKNLISTTQNIISVDELSIMDLPRRSKVYSSFHNRKLSFFIPPFNNFSESAKHKNFQFQKDVSNYIPVIKNSSNFEKNSSESRGFDFQINTVNRQRFNIKSNLNVYLTKPINFLMPSILKSNFSIPSNSMFHFHNNHPYITTLKSIQNNKSNSSASTFNNPLIRSTIITNNAIFKTLISSAFNEVNHDPYYPKFPTTTEVYYTPRYDKYKFEKPYLISTSKPVLNVNKFMIPFILPDLNNIEDLLDRKKFFFIPREK